MARPKMDPNKTKLSKTVTISPADVDLLLKLGDGNLSAGIEQAVDLVREVGKERGLKLPGDDLDSIFK